MKKILQYLQTSVVGIMLVTLPAWSCQAVPLTGDEAAARDAAVADGDIDAAVEIENGANERHVEGLLSLITPFIPGGEALKKSAAVLIATAAFPRPRRHYLNALRAVGKSAIAINPIGSDMAPGEAAKELFTAVKAMMAAPGLVHTETVEGPKEPCE